MPIYRPKAGISRRRFEALEAQREPVPIRVVLGAGRNTPCRRAGLCQGRCRLGTSMHSRGLSARGFNAIPCSIRRHRLRLAVPPSVWSLQYQMAEILVSNDALSRCSSSPPRAIDKANSGKSGRCRSLDFMRRAECAVGVEPPPFGGARAGRSGIGALRPFWSG